MTNDPDLIRFIEGACTPEEAAAIQRWVAADPERAALLRELRAVWHATGDAPAPQRWDLSAARERLRRAGAGATAAASPPNAAPAATPAPPPRGASALARWSVRVAIASLAVAAGLLLASRRSQNFPEREYATEPGQRAELSLRDGSRVLLSVDTRLRVPSDFGNSERAVELNGQAYFIVRHDARRPFVVRTHRGVAEDLGTEFDVRAYADEPFVQVVVAEGKVALAAARGSDARGARLTLYPRDRGLIDALGTVSRTTSVAVNDYVSWTRGALVFHNAPVDSVIGALRRWYDVDLRAATLSLGEERITITFTTESSAEAISALAEVLNTQVVRSEGVVRLIPNRSRNR